MHDISSGICEAAVEPSGYIDEHVVTIVFVLDVRNIEDCRVFCNKEVLKLNTSFFAIQNMFKIVVVQGASCQVVTQ